MSARNEYEVFVNALFLGLHKVLEVQEKSEYKKRFRASAYLGFTEHWKE
jgi:hypothetical protein